MALVPNTPHQTAVDIVTGHFDERAGYGVWRENGTDDWLLFFTLRGKGRVGHRAGEVITEPGEGVLIRPRTLHDYGVESTLEHWEFLWAHFQPRPHWMDWLAWPEEAPGILRLRVDAAMRAKVEASLVEMHAAATGAARRRNALALCALEKALLLFDAVNPLHAFAAMDERVREAMDYLCRNMTRRVKLEEVASHVNLSLSRFAHLFREQAGTTPQQFLEIQRLDRAKQLLAHTSHSIKQVAFMLGYESPFYFTMRFKRYTKLGPREWRKKHVRI